jgi:hypothetical protein
MERADALIVLLDFGQSLRFSAFQAATLLCLLVDPQLHAAITPSPGRLHNPANRCFLSLAIDPPSLTIYGRSRH